jgi:hypothetical protein
MLNIKKQNFEFIMKKSIFQLFLLIFSILFLHCDKDNGLENDSMKLAEGTWHGEFGEAKVVFTLIESRFEKSIPISGTTYLMSDSLAYAYQIMNGNRNDNSLIFSLYEIPINGKEEYHIQGEIINQYFEGSFDQLDSTGTILRTGAFSVERIP